VIDVEAGCVFLEDEITQKVLLLAWDEVGTHWDGNQNLITLDLFTIDESTAQTLIIENGSRFFMSGSPLDPESPFISSGADADSACPGTLWLVNSVAVPQTPPISIGTPTATPG